MTALYEFCLESLRMLSFLTVLGIGIMGIAPLTGCEQPATDPVPTTTDPAPVTPDEDAEITPDSDREDIDIKAPGVDIDIDRTPDGNPDAGVDVDVNPPGGGVDVDVDPR